MGTALYTRQVDTKFAGFPYNPGREKGELWFNALMEYGFTVDGKLCPEAPAYEPANISTRGIFAGSSSAAWRETDNYAPNNLTQAEKDDYLQASYGINSYNYSPPANASSNARVAGVGIATFRKRNFGSSDDMDNPTNTPVFGDATWRNASVQVGQRVSGDPIDPWGQGFRSGIARFQFERHPGRANNFAFGDGHAASVEVNDIDQLTWYRGWEDDLGTQQMDVAW